MLHVGAVSYKNSFDFYDNKVENRWEKSSDQQIFNLVANKNKSLSAKFLSSGGLFSELASEKTINNFLLEEFKNVDYFLKVHSDYEKIPTRNLISSINQIEQVISAYLIENDRIKTKKVMITAHGAAEKTKKRLNDAGFTVYDASMPP